MSPDLKDLIDGIESTENVTAEMQSKIDRLKEIVEKQKKMIADQNKLLEQQKGQLDGQLAIPDDIYELKEMIGAQRAQLNAREAELEAAKSDLGQVQKELEMTKTRLDPTQSKLSGSLDTIGKLKAELAQKSSEILVKNETLTTLANKVGEVEAFSKNLQEERAKLIEEMSSKQSGEFQSKLDDYLKKIEEAKMETVNVKMSLREEHVKEISKLKEEHMNETMALKEELGKLDSMFADSRLDSTEAGAEAKNIGQRLEDFRNKHEELVGKIESLNDEKRVLNVDLQTLNKAVDSLSTWKTENTNKIEYFDRLTILMEQDPLFKTFLVVMEVGAIAIDDLQKALGAPIVIVKKNIEKMQQIDLLDFNDLGKIVIKRFDAPQA